MGSIEKFIKTICVQPAIYWGNPQPDGFGKYEFDAPVQIYVRWDDKNQVVTDKNGKEVLSNAEIMVTQDLDELGMLLLGELGDLDSTADPYESGAVTIMSKTKIPMIKSKTDFVRKVYIGK